MPIKVLVMVRRRPDLTPEQFREGYEKSHARLAVQLFGHLWLSYRRNYLVSGRRFGLGHSTGSPAVPDETGFDVISEYVLHDASAQSEMSRIALENLALIKDDEALWFDQAHCFSMACEVSESDIRDRSGAIPVSR